MAILRVSEVKHLIGIVVIIQILETFAILNVFFRFARLTTPELDLNIIHLLGYRHIFC